VIAMRRFLAIVLAALATVSMATPAAGKDAVRTTLVPGKAVMVTRNGLDCFYFAGTGYRDLSATRLKVKVIVEGFKVAQPVRRLLDGYWAQRIEIVPCEDGSEVTVGRSLAGGTYAIATAPASDALGGKESVVLALTYGLESADALPAASSMRKMEPDPDYPRMDAGRPYEPGEYRLPAFETKYRFSDIRVNLNLNGADFREVLMFMSEISGVSIILDPYWSDEPTGGRRRPGGPGGGQELPPPASETPPGQFREGDVFQASLPRQGIGTLTMNLENVPFDLALDLILTAVNLERIVIYPPGAE